MQENITLKRTKATCTTVEGIRREESLDIIDVLKNQTFKIVLDESTDVSATQILALLARYVNANTLQTVDRCFEIIEVLDGTSLGLFKAVFNVLFEKHFIPPKNLIGIGADNCATMKGKISVFQAQLKEACPHIFVNGCICRVWQCAYLMLPRNCLLEFKTLFVTLAAIFLTAAKAKI